jgi:hypothetical protein
LACDVEGRSDARERIGRSEPRQSAAVGSLDANQSDRPRESRRKERETPLADLPDSVLDQLAESGVASIDKGKGGRTLAFVVALEDGTVGYFKPEQSFAANWYAEMASFHLDREIGLGRVAPSVGRRLPWEALERAARGDQRVRELLIGEDGTLRGSLVAWIAGPLERLEPGGGWESWLRIDPPFVISPFQRPEEYWEAVKLGKERAGARARHATLSAAPTPIPDRADRPSELSDLILFDYLIANLDRWGGNFTNVRTRGAGGPLVYLDNANGFPPKDTRSPLLETRLSSVQRFRRSTIERIRGFDMDRFRARLGRDPLGPLLTERQLRDLEARRKRLLAYVEGVERLHGEAAFPW